MDQEYQEARLKNRITELEYSVADLEYQEARLEY